MTILPQLEAAIVEATQTATRRRRRLRRVRPAILPALGAAAACALLVAAVLALGAPGDEAADDSAPAEAVRRSAQLTVDPTLQSSGTDSARPEPLSPSGLRTVVQELRGRLPYPPGVVDAHLDGLQTSDGSLDMGRVDFASDVERLAQHRAWCLWIARWLAVRGAEQGEAIRTATTVLEQAPRWSSFRDGGYSGPSAVADAVRADDASAVAAVAGRGCELRVRQR